MINETSRHFSLNKNSFFYIILHCLFLVLWYIDDSLNQINHREKNIFNSFTEPFCEWLFEEVNSWFYLINLYLLYSSISATKCRNFFLQLKQNSNSLYLSPFYISELFFLCSLFLCFRKKIISFQILNKTNKKNEWK